MTAAEHAIENAVSALEHGIEFEVWLKTDMNLEYLNADAHEVWDMAQWVVYTKCMYCENKCDDKLCPERGMICDGS